MDLASIVGFTSIALNKPFVLVRRVNPSPTYVEGFRCFPSGFRWWLLMGFRQVSLVSFGFPMGFQGLPQVSYGFLCVSHRFPGFPAGCLRFSTGFPMGFRWPVCYGFPMVCYGFPVGSYGFAMGFWWECIRIISDGLTYGFPMISLQFAMGCLRVSCGVSGVPQHWFPVDLFWVSFGFLAVSFVFFFQFRVAITGFYVP